MSLMLKFIQLKLLQEVRPNSIHLSDMQQINL